MRATLRHQAFQRSLHSLDIPLMLTLFAVGFTTACGSGNQMATTTPPPLTGNTQVTVALSSTANDQLAQFYLQLESLTLTSQSGKVVTIYSSPSLQQDYEYSELMHVNGLINPLLSLSLPQDVYTAATATIGYAQFTCVSLVPSYGSDPGGLFSNTFAYGQTPSSDVTVSLPSPITITGESMGLMLDMQVSQSENFGGTCYMQGLAQYSITPTFNLTPLSFAAQPTNANNGKVVGLDGEVTALGTTGSGLTLTLPFQEGSRTFTVAASSSTVYEGIGGFASLSVGTFIDIDAAIQPDGSLLASRIAVQDPSAINVMSGPLLNVTSSVATLGFYPIEQQGPGATNSIGGEWLDYGNSVFKISSQLTNLSSLPFVPAFTATNMVAGQNLYVTAPQLIFIGGQYTPLNTITLIPQTVNGTIVASSTVGNFTDYTVSLASYDLFPTFAVQQGQTTLLNNPSQVEVYVDSSTQMLNTQTLTAGNTMRFYGLVFNDNGTLRMDCAQVNDGVSTSSPSVAANRSEKGQTRITRRQGPGGLHQTIALTAH